MKLFHVLLILICLAVGYGLWHQQENSFSCSYTPKEGEKTYKVLFIGNSYTFYNDMPKMLECIAAHNEVAVQATMVVKGGETMRGHWERGDAFRAIVREKWDFVVLQEQSLALVFDNTKRDFLTYASFFAQEIKKTGAKPVFFETWARQPNTAWYQDANIRRAFNNAGSMQFQLHYVYGQLANANQSLLVPVGGYWRKHPHVESLYAKDATHPSVQGSYFTALAFYKHLFSKPLDGDAWRPSGVTKEEKETFSEILAK